MCEHLLFRIQAGVQRLSESQDGESIRCTVQLQGQCAGCGVPLQFALPPGPNLLEAASMSKEGTVAYLAAGIGCPNFSPEVTATWVWELPMRAGRANDAPC